MNNRLTIFILLTLILAGCSSSGDRFTVEGRLLNMDQGEFYVYSPDGGINGIDTIRLMGGRLSYDIVCTAPTTLVVVFPNFSEQPIFAEPGASVKIEGDASHLKEMKVKGTKTNSLMNTFREQIANASPPQAVQYAETFIKDHPASPVSVYLLRRYFIASVTPDYARALKLCRIMAKANPKNGLLTFYEQQLKQLSRVVEGKKLPRFTAVDVNGKKVDNASLGKGLAVIMAYATWNFDAQRMQQDVRQLEKKNKGRLKVIGLCADPDPKQCRNTVNRDSIPWPVICDGRMLESPALQTLSLFDIPDNILVNNGVVIAKGLTNDELKKRIEHML